MKIEDIDKETNYQEMACDLLHGVEFEDQVAIAKAVHAVAQYIETNESNIKELEKKLTEKADHLNEAVEIITIFNIAADLSDTKGKFLPRPHFKKRMGDFLKTVKNDEGKTN